MPLSPSLALSLCVCVCLGSEGSGTTDMDPLSDSLITETAGNTQVRCAALFKRISPRLMNIAFPVSLVCASACSTPNASARMHQRDTQLKAVWKSRS